MTSTDEGNGAMAFDTPNGTRGARQPGRTRIEQWASRGMVNRIRRRGRPERAKTLVLVTVGRKTGAERITPVRRFPARDGSTVIVASASGAARNPSWYYNLAAHPDRARIEYAGQRVEVSARQLHGPERDEVWRQITAQAPGYARYEKTTDRVIPLIRLTPRAARGGG
jgi:deazaflavin-dependent oxidoreductase (nitroreductase family)